MLNKSASLIYKFREDQRNLCFCNKSENLTKILKEDFSDVELAIRMKTILRVMRF